MLARTAHKPEFRQISIDRKTLRYAVTGPEGQRVPSGFSTGERTLLALCLVQGIRAAAGSQFPLIIEAPLKPLDPLHQEAVARHLFKDYAGQVILLVKPDEIPKDLAFLEKQRVARRFEVCQSANGRQSGIQEVHSTAGGAHA